MVPHPTPDTLPLCPSILFAHRPSPPQIYPPSAILSPAAVSFPLRSLLPLPPPPAALARRRRCPHRSLRGNLSLSESEGLRFLLKFELATGASLATSAITTHLLPRRPLERQQPYPTSVIAKSILPLTISFLHCTAPGVAKEKGSTAPR